MGSFQCFIKRGSGSGANKWYVHHEGGGWCYGDEGCGLRGKGAGESQRKTPDGPLVYTNLGRCVFRLHLHEKI